MEALGIIGLVYLLAGIIQLVILIVLIVKFLQLAADVKQLKNLYTERSRELSSSIDKLSSAIKEQSNSKDNDKPHVAKDENIVAELKKEPNKPYNEAPAKRCRQWMKTAMTSNNIYANGRFLKTKDIQTKLSENTWSTLSGT